MSNGKATKAKKGCVVNRKHNRTINQDVAQSAPRWEDMGGGILKKRGPGNETAYIKRQGKNFVSLTRKQVDVALAPKATDQIAA